MHEQSGTALVSLQHPPSFARTDVTYLAHYYQSSSAFDPYSTEVFPCKTILPTSFSTLPLLRGNWLGPPSAYQTISEGGTVLSSDISESKTLKGGA